MSDKTLADEQKLAPAPAPRSAIERSQRLASALSSYARALTFENRSRRNLYRLAGLTPRTRDRVFSAVLMAVIGIAFVAPMIGSVVYFAFVASPRYVSEVRFIVRSSVPFLSRDRYSSDAVEPKAKIVQDTAVMLNYIASPAIIQDLQKQVDLHHIFGRDDIDRFSRLRDDATQDDILKYWKRRATTSVNPKSGIVELEVSAFTPQEAHDLTRLVLKLSEDQVNRLSAGMWNDLLVSTQRDVDTATKDVSDLRGQLRDTQNSTGVFDVDLSAGSIITVLTSIEQSIAELKSRRMALGQSVGDSAPQMGDIDRRIAALEQQATELRSKTAGAGTDGQGNLANYSSVFDKLKLDLKMAEGKLTNAISDLEKVKLVSSLQLVYIDNFTEPTTPDTAKYPNTALEIFLKFLLFAAITGSACGLIILLRKKLD